MCCLIPQCIPLEAVVVLPVLKLSTSRVDFGTCLVGETREINIILSNSSTSASQWHATVGESTNSSLYL